MDVYTEELYLNNSIFLFLIFIASVIAAILVWIFHSPFKYPYYFREFDISGKRSPKPEDLLDNYINKNGMEDFSNHFKYVQRWKKECQNTINRGKLKRRRYQQFLACLDDENMFCFSMIRSQTRYSQKNYVKSSYQVYVTVDEFSKSYSDLLERYNALKEIGFECTLSEYHAKNQRKMMTKALRDKIAARDNFTCQICGKYMPDGVGLHIDHIIPIAKGGKSVPSNLQVLCSKCNGRKSKK